MQTWEYKSFLTNGPGMEDALNQLGQEGWEAIAVVPTTHHYEDGQAISMTWTATQWGVTQYRIVLKRAAPGR